MGGALIDPRRYGLSPSGSPVSNSQAWDRVRAEFLATGDAIEIQSGVFQVDQMTIENGMVLRGSGTTLQMPVRSSGDGRPLVDCLGSATFIKVAFDGQKSLQPADGFSDSYNGGAGGTGRKYRSLIHADQRAGLYFRDLDFSNAYGACICANACNDVRVIDCSSKDCYFELYYHTGGSSSRTKHHDVRGCKIENTGLTGDSATGNAILVAWADYVSIVGNTAVDLDRNLAKVSNCNHFSVSDNKVSGVRQGNFAGIQVQTAVDEASEHFRVSGNLIHDCQTGIAINAYSASNVVVEGNQISDITGPSTPDGILLAAGPKTGIVVRGNVIRGAARHGIYSATALDNSVVDGNLVIPPSGGTAGFTTGMLFTSSSGQHDLTIQNNQILGHGNNAALWVAGSVDRMWIKSNIIESEGAVAIDAQTATLTNTIQSENEITGSVLGMA